MRLQKMLAAAIAVLMGLSCLLPAAFGEAELQISASFGYDGVITYLSAMPLRVTLENGGEDAELVVAVNVNRTEREYDRYEYPLTLAGGARVELTMPLTVNYKQSSFTVEVLKNGKTVAQCEVKPQRIVSPATLLVGVLSADAQALSYMNINTTNDALLRGDVWQTVGLTAETFPDNAEMLGAFRILAVDGVDVSALTDGQRQALRAWIEGGGIVIVGGGAAGIAAGRGFSALTGVMAAAPHQAQGVDQALWDYLSGTRFAMNATARVQGDVLLSTLRGGSGALVTLGDEVLIDRCPVGNGVIYTTAFSLSEKPLSSWSGMAGFWQRMLLSADSVLYQRVMNELNNYYNKDNWYPDNYILRRMELENDSHMLYAVLVIALFILMTGVGSYVILKKLDKREWMWVTVPVLSLCSAGALMLMSRGMTLNRPALAAYTVITVDKNGYTDSMTMAGVASASNRPLTISAQDGSRIYTASEYMNYYTDEETLEQEKKLRYIYSQGRQPSLTLPAASAWDVQTLLIAPGEQSSVAVSATVWWEEDGLHGEVRNASELTLLPGYAFVNDCGFCTIPALRPGQTAEFAIVRTKETDKKPDASGESVWHDGELIENAGSRYISVYELMNSAFSDENAQENLSNEEIVRRGFERSLLQSAMRNPDASAFFHYMALTEGTEPAAITINGERVERVTGCGVLDVEMRYQAVSQSGLVRLTRGMVPLYGATLDVKNRPMSNGVKADDYSYYSLREEPMICFDLSADTGLDMERIELSRVTFNCENYGTLPRIWLYNAGNAQWEEAQYTAFPIVFDGESMQRYLNAQGQLFIRFTQRGVDNSELYNPALTLEGKVK